MRHRLLIVVCSLAAGAVVSPASADQYDTLNVVVSTSIVYDSNVFKVPDSISLPASLGTQKSDVISVSSVGLKLNKPYRQQRFQFELSETIYRYANFSFLDFEATDYRGAWLWHLTPRVSGTLRADRKKTVVPFQDVTNRGFEGFQQALRTVENRAADIDAWVTGPWHFVGGVSQIQVQDSRLITDEQAYDATTYDYGIKYAAQSGSSISLVQRHVRGDYQQGRLDPINFLDSGFRERQSEVRAHWIASGLSSWTGRIAWIDRKHEHFSQRDFDGLVGGITYTWVPTGKMRFNVSARRELTTFWNQLFSSYRITNGLTVGSTWHVAAHTAIEMRYDWTERDAEGALIAFAGPARSDTAHRARVYINWAPRRSVIVRAGIERYVRSSNVPQFEFDSTIGNLTATLTF